MDRDIGLFEIEDIMDIDVCRQFKRSEVPPSCDAKVDQISPAEVSEHYIVKYSVYCLFSAVYRDGRYKKGNVTLFSSCC